MGGVPNGAESSTCRAVYGSWRGRGRVRGARRRPGAADVREITARGVRRAPGPRNSPSG